MSLGFSIALERLAGMSMTTLEVTNMHPKSHFSFVS